jgi:hypothetical protein
MIIMMLISRMAPIVAMTTAAAENASGRGEQCDNS